MSEHEHRWHDDLRQMETCGCGKTRIVGTRDPADDSARHWRNLALNTEAKRLRAEAEVERLREGMEALVTRYRIAWDEDGDMEAHGYAEDLLDLLNPTEGETRE